MRNVRTVSLYVLYQTVLSDTPEIRSVLLVFAEKQTLYQYEYSTHADLKFFGPSRILGTQEIGLVGSRSFLSFSALLALRIYGTYALLFCIRYI